MMSLPTGDDARLEGVAGASREEGPGAPTALRIVLGAQLRRLREERGVSREQAANAIRATHSKISRLERGRSPARDQDIADLLTLYHVTDPDERARFLDLARRARSAGWWHSFRDVMPDWLEPYVGLEETATMIRSYDLQFVNGLLQTPDYARAVMMLRHAPESELERRVALRMRRQQILTRTDPPTLWVVLDEAAVRRPYGGRQVMRGQLEHLLEISALPNVTVQILPFTTGGHAAAGGPFTLLRFSEPDLPDIVYLEALNSGFYLDKRDDVEDYASTMNRLCVDAEAPQATTGILRGILADT